MHPAVTGKEDPAGPESGERRAQRINSLIEEVRGLKDKKDSSPLDAARRLSQKWSNKGAAL